MLIIGDFDEFFRSSSLFKENMSSVYKIWYFDGKRGRAEQIRLTLKAAQVPYEDEVGAAAQFGAKKASGDLAYGSYPMLEV